MYLYSVALDKKDPCYFIGTDENIKAVKELIYLSSNSWGYG